LFVLSEQLGIAHFVYWTDWNTLGLWDLFVRSNEKSKRNNHNLLLLLSLGSQRILYSQLMYVYTHIAGFLEHREQHYVGLLFYVVSGWTRKSNPWLSPKDWVVYIIGRESDLGDFVQGGLHFKVWIGYGKQKLLSLRPLKLST